MNPTNKSIRVPVGEFRVDKAERRAIAEVLDSGRISEGEKVREFEEKWARYIGTKHSVVLNSGTSALIAGLASLKHLCRNQGRRFGAKIVTTPISYVATSNAIVLCGLEPIYVDVDEGTFCITPENIRAHLEAVDDPDDYALILPVHLMGYPCDMDGINRVAKNYGLLVFEDSAQAHGTLYRGRKVGSLSFMSAFSFYIAHNIQVGEMGAIATSDSEIAKLTRKIKANGRECDCPVCTRKDRGCPKLKRNGDDQDPRFTHDMIGYNFKSMEFQAALGLVQLGRIERIIERRRENVKYLNEALSKFSSAMQLPKYDENVSYMAYPVVIRDPKKACRRKIRQRLERMGVETRPLFGCIPTQQPAYSHLKDKYDEMLPVANHVGANAFYIGCHQYLTREQLDHVIKAFGDVYREFLE